MNSELAKVKRWCDINKLYINMSKTNFIIVKPTRKKDIPISLNIRKSDASFYSFKRKQCIKHLGVMIEDSLKAGNITSHLSVPVYRETLK